MTITMNDITLEQNPRFIWEPKGDGIHPMWIDSIDDHLSDAGVFDFNYHVDESQVSALCDLVDSGQSMVRAQTAFINAINEGIDSAVDNKIDELRKRFTTNIQPSVVEQYGEEDIALNEAFNNWTDALCKNGEICDRTYNTATRESN